MHEFSIASSIVDAVLDLARKQGADRVFEVHLRIGKLRALSVEQVKFSYDVLVKGTVLEGSKLLTDEIPGRVRCSSCEYESQFDPEEESYHFGVPSLICPNCSASLETQGGDDCVITRVTMQIPPEATQASGSSQIR